MKTKISNEITIENPSKELLAWCNDNLILNNPEYQQLIRLGKENVIKWKHIPEKVGLFSFKLGNLILPFGLLKSIWGLIKNDPYELVFNNNPDISIKNDVANGIDFYDYQEEAIDKMVQAKGGILVSGCGSGKTIMGTELIHRLGKRTLWLCHTGDLLRQARDDMLELYPNLDIGLTTDGKLNIGKDVTISTVQTMCKIDPMLYKDEFDVVICDECAHVASNMTQLKMFTKVLTVIPARYKYGLTATPCRADGLIKAMYAYLGTNKTGDFAPTHKVDRSKVKTMTAFHTAFRTSAVTYEDACEYEAYDTAGMMSDYNALISCICDNKQRNEQILNQVDYYNKIGRKQVVLSLRVEHCEYLVEELQKRGINAVLCVGKTSAKKREEILKQKVKWDVIVSTYSLLKEGVSIKELDTLHLCCPAKEKGLIVQCAGRIERYLEGKPQPIIIDYVDTDIPYCDRAYEKRISALRRRF